MYYYWMVFLYSDGTLMSSASVIYGIGCFQPYWILHTLHVITYVTLVDLQWTFPLVG